MKLQIDIHSAQIEVLRVLLFQPIARFRDLNPTHLSNDHLSFHLKRLQELGLLEKTGDKYQLTIIGKEFANRLDTDEKVIEKQGKISALIIPRRRNADKTQLLIQQRLKSPFFGFHGFLGGKIRWGEQVLEGAARELREETNLTCDLTLIGEYHKLNSTAAGQILEDKYFKVVLADNPQGELLSKFEGGANSWLTLEQIRKLDMVFEDMNDFLAAFSPALDGGQAHRMIFHEQSYLTDLKDF